LRELEGFWKVDLAVEKVGRD